MAYEAHDFYCLKCGTKGLPVHRNTGHQHGAMHRKKLWCFKCQCEVNHIEIRNYSELETFRENFENGVYIDEVEESLAHVRNSRQW